MDQQTDSLVGRPVCNMFVFEEVVYENVLAFVVKATQVLTALLHPSICTQFSKLVECQSC